MQTGHIFEHAADIRKGALAKNSRDVFGSHNALGSKLELAQNPSPRLDELGVLGVDLAPAVPMAKGKWSR
jgi:hypothetical protein